MSNAACVTGEMDRRQLLRRWVWASFAGWLLGFVLVLAGSVSLDGVGIEHSQFVVGLGMGAGVGLGQASAMKRWLGDARGWALASALGMGGAFVAFELLAALGVGLGELRMPLSVISGAVVIGLVQRGRLGEHVEGARWWVLACVVSWALAAATGVSGSFLSNFLELGRWPSFALNLALLIGAGAVLGLVSGAALLRLGAQPS